MKYCTPCIQYGQNIYICESSRIFGDVNTTKQDPSTKTIKDMRCFIQCET